MNNNVLYIRIYNFAICVKCVVGYILPQVNVWNYRVLFGFIWDL